jgi:hypothetical protein
MPPSPSYWKNSTIAPSASAKDRAPACSPNWTGRHCSRCQPNATSWPTGKRCAPRSITTSKWTVIITASPTNWPARSLEARFTATTVEILHGGKRVASHARSSAAYRHTTVSEHMPKSHQAHLEWTPSRLIHWAEGVGVATAEVVRTILERKPHPEMGYRACLGILSLEKMYSKPRLEAASQRAVQLQAFSYQSLKSILKRSLDRQLVLDPEAVSPGPRHENLRGPTVLRSAHQAGAVAPA